MIRATLAILLAAFLNLAEPVSAQAQMTPEQRAEYEALQNRFRAFHDVRDSAIHDPYLKWLVVFSRIDAWGNTWTVVSFGLDMGRSPPVWQAELHTNASSNVHVLNAVNCPALLVQLAALEALPMPEIDLPQLGPPPTSVPGTVLNGDDNRIWTNGAGWNRRMLFTDELELSGNVGTPVALWGDHMLAALGPCWRTAR